MVLAILFFSFFATIVIYRWFERRLRRLRKEREKQHLLARLELNWSELLDSEWVDGLSQMPKKWKSGIVPVRSETGASLHKQLQVIAKKIIMVSTHSQYCCEHRRHACLIVLKKKMHELIKQEVAPFFASRDAMYRRYLISDPGSPTLIKRHSFVIKLASIKSPLSQVFSASKRRMSDGERPWPENSNDLFRQTMLLLRDLDNMFKASYNQRYDLYILHDERKTYAEWMENQLPQLIPKRITLAQNTPHLFELYRQAARTSAFLLQ